MIRPPVPLPPRGPWRGPLRRPPIFIGAALLGGYLPTPVGVAPSVIVADSVPVPDVIETPAAPAPATGTSTAMQIVELDNGPAKEAGLQVNDVILTVDGRRTQTFAELRAALTASSGKSQFQVYSPASERLRTVDVNVVGTMIGASVIPVPVEVDESALTPSQTGLQVQEIPAGAKLGGLAVGDVILGVDGKWVTTEAELNAAIAAGKGKSELVLYRPSSESVEKVTIAGPFTASVTPVPVQIQK